MKSLKPMTNKQILKLKPEFDFGGMGMRMIDWFIITEGHGFHCIQSGLRHADGETKSPYHYEKCIGGKNAKKESLKLFTEWWTKKNMSKPAKIKCGICGKKIDPLKYAQHRPKCKPKN